MNTISLTAAQIRQLVGIAKDALPNESCAFLLGHNDKVAKILPMRNIDESPVTFSIEPAELLHAYNLAESKGMQVIAIFHSHPAKPWPSSTDIKFMEINPVVWIIYSTTESQLKAFVYDDDELIKEIDIIITGVRA
ncbi:MAG TPA: M67 family metallopeptidase [Nitrososphaera sp.]|jgi:[CysO sulfur-carrier protein]-S-L-cysteine hydrolase|nr:M67 family metallopeptidase [Nitrososphaera sp.]